jgi:hypothetical protein
VSGLVNNSIVRAYTVASGHGEVGKEGECRDEGSDYVEKAFLLSLNQYRGAFESDMVEHTTGTLQAMK